MNTKSIILSAAGLRNIVQNDVDYQVKFYFNFGELQIEMNKIFAQFISPKVARLCQVDPTVNSIYINTIIPNFQVSSSISTQSIHDLFTEEIISLIQQVASGFSIEISQDQGFLLQLVSIILGNEELFDKINEIYPIKINEANLDLYLRNLHIFSLFSKATSHFKYTNIINFIANHFYLIEPEQVIHLPRYILYSIISNKNLRIESEDNLLDFIQTIFSKEESDKNCNINQPATTPTNSEQSSNQTNNNNNPKEDESCKNSDDDYFTIADFYEVIEISGLSENKFRDFILNLNLNDMTSPLWRHVCTSLFPSESQLETLKNERYVQQHPRFNYDGHPEHQFEGIISHLTKECGGNVQDKNVVKITASSTYSNYYPKYAADLTDDQHYYFSNSQPNTWLKYDFQKLKVRPNSYSIRSRHDDGQKGCHLRCWVIEGSNSGNEDDWKILDTQSGITDLDDRNATYTFDIDPPLGQNDFYRFLRIRQTGTNTAGSNYLAVSALEFFGSIMC
ncbi:hypothetical protein M9Y10_020806 [Tritrichomonas musculus]|uniref:F5/8 type C domain-containing protein n=1 Tax=Tritrichomonas musculus TaxID=1915356 RepID=A0ABR2HFQ3_9EUKA